ncbi:arylesterase [Nitratidesulfovibrio sp. D1]|uniref:arylesterase n=1 Tax=Nitratidesulfovibrio sp. D1 TaxID=3440151 RepID=UPI003EC0B62C
MIGSVTRITFGGWGRGRALAPARWLVLSLSLALALCALPVLAPATSARAANDGGNSSIPHILVLGDSLVAGYGLGPGEAFPEMLGAALHAKGRPVRVTNAGVSGDTSAGGLARVEWSLDDKPDLLILELGANDALRGLPVDDLRRNLAAIIEASRKRGVRVLLAGMHAPRNLGPDYIRRFDAVYPELAKHYGLTLYPFFLDGVALDRSLNLPDGMHPNPKGVQVIVERMLPVVERELDVLRTGN